jgi:hypothetical protein
MIPFNLILIRNKFRASRGKYGYNTFHVLHENKPYKAEILSADFNHKTYTIKVNNNSYTVAISNDLDQLIHELDLRWID